MFFSSPKTIVVSVALLFALAFAELAYGGGSGLNTIVVVNQNSADSVEVGNYYCQRRQIPAQNVVLISWPGANTMWTNTDFEAVLLNPLLNAITNRQLDR